MWKGSPYGWQPWGTWPLSGWGCRGSWGPTAASQSNCHATASYACGEVDGREGPQPAPRAIHSYLGLVSLEGHNRTPMNPYKLLGQHGGITFRPSFVPESAGKWRTYIRKRIARWGARVLWGLVLYHHPSFASIGHLAQIYITALNILHHQNMIESVKEDFLLLRWLKVFVLHHLLPTYLSIRIDRKRRAVHNAPGFLDPTRLVGLKSDMSLVPMPLP
jgi:hypothetical protein